MGTIQFHPSIFFFRTQANYLLWRTARHLLNFLDTKARAIQLTFEKAITGKEATAAR